MWLALPSQITLDFLFTHSHCRNTSKSLTHFTITHSHLSIMCGFIMLCSPVFTQSSERCCCIRHSQYCHWSSQSSILLQVGIIHCMDVVPRFIVHMQFERKTCCKAIYQGWHFVHIQASGWSRSDLRAYSFLSGMPPYLVLCASHPSTCMQAHCQM